MDNVRAYSLQPTAYSLQPTAYGYVYRRRRSTPRDTLVEDSIRCHQFGIQDGCAGSAANGIVSERDEFRMHHFAGSHAADCYCHAVATICIKTRLRPVLFACDD